MHAVDWKQIVLLRLAMECQVVTKQAVATQKGHGVLAPYGTAAAQQTLTLHAAVRWHTAAIHTAVQ
jgi:hypothetical protein